MNCHRSQFVKMARVYKSICNETDLHLLKISHLTEKIIKYKVYMEKLMNKGFVSIAKARYIMGSTCVTKMQLPSEKSNPIQPVATVCRAKLNDHWVFHVHRKDVANPNKMTSGKTTESYNNSSDNSNPISPDPYQHPQESAQIKVSFSESDFRNALVNDPKSLKRSKTVFHINDDNYQDFNDELLDEFSNNSGSDESLCSLEDPLRLFGVLVPNTLKQGQDTFKDVVSLLGKCATLQSELKEIFTRYNHLVQVKALMETAAKEANLNITKPKVYWMLSDISIQSSSESKETEKDGVSITKSIRSVFYDVNELDFQEDELSLWSTNSSVMSKDSKLSDKKQHL